LLLKWVGFLPFVSLPKEDGAMRKMLIKNIERLYQVGDDLEPVVKGKDMSFVPFLELAYLALEDGIIVDYGLMSDLSGITDWNELEVIDATGQFVLPSFCDSHTHAVFARSREEEFVDRINGLSYEEIASRGGGILQSARRLAELSEEELFSSAKKRIGGLMQNGTGAIEIKSGYGLSVEGELKMLRVIKRLKEELPITVKATFLGAHAFPLPYKENHEGYIQLILEEMLPAIEKENLADFIDVFCERNYFSVAEMKRILDKGKEHGLIPKVHVNQFSILGGVQQAIAQGALSVDHLEELNESDIEALQQSNCMPTLLPGCSHFLGIPYGDARKIIDAGLPLALASDYNPGSSPNGNLMHTFSLACVKLKMTPEEALNALTVNAAYAMGLSDSHGKIARGLKIPLILTKPIPSLAYIPYAWGEDHIDRIIH
jgi:imidazolonepropionase